MKRLLFLSTLVLLLFSRCHKEEPLKVTFSVTETSQDQPEYSISYTGDKSGTTNAASANDNRWDSGTILLDRGQFVSLKVDCSAPVYDLTLRIYVSGFLWKETNFANPVASATLTGTL